MQKLFNRTTQFWIMFRNTVLDNNTLTCLALRLYLAPIFWMAGTSKLAAFSDTVEWFGNSEWGLGLPFPAIMASLATACELLGAICLAFGFATRLISFPLIITMLVAIFAVHLPNGWQAIADAQAPFSNAQVLSSVDKLAKAREILQEYGDYDWLTSSGKFVILNNGIEFAVTYLIMLLALLNLGGGKYTSLDYYLAKHFLQKPVPVSYTAINPPSLEAR